jgi:hypothetical protein
MDDKLRKIAERIAKLLPELSLEENDSCWRLTFRSAGIGRVYVDYCGVTSRLTFSGDYPRDSDNNSYGPSFADRPRISASLLRDDEAIAKDVRKRFLGPYRDTYKESLEKAAVADAKREGRIVVLHRIAGLLGETGELKSSERLHAYAHGVREVYVSYDASHVDLKLDSIPTELALLIVGFLAERLPEKNS